MTRPRLRSLCEGQQVSRKQGISFSGMDDISLELLAVLGLHQTRYNCIHIGDTAGQDDA